MRFLDKIKSFFIKPSGKLLKIDPNKIEFDGHSWRLVIKDEEELKNILMIKQAEMLKEIQENELDSYLKEEEK